MEILNQIERYNGRTVVALGYFDGVHLGHRAVIETACACARETGATPAALTFDMRAFRAAAKGKGDLDTYENRAHCLAALGIAVLMQLEFGAVAQMTPAEFVRAALGPDGLRAQIVCCGADFRFGKGRAGDVDTLRALCAQYGFEIRVVPAVHVDGEIVSTTRIKGCVACGDMPQATALLGHPYGFTLPVSEDKKLARTLGFPTINQRFPDGLLAPRFGVYRARVRVDDVDYDGISNIGVRPSVHSDGAIMLETHIIDFSGDLYGQLVTVELVGFLRDEKKFASVDALREQVERDIETVRRAAGKINR